MRIKRISLIDNKYREPFSVRLFAVTLVFRVSYIMFYSLTGNFQRLRTCTGGGGGGGEIAQSVERATPGEDVPGSIRCGHPLPTGSVGVSIM